MQWYVSRIYMYFIPKIHFHSRTWHNIFDFKLSKYKSHWIKKTTFWNFLASVCSAILCWNSQLLTQIGLGAEIFTKWCTHEYIILWKFQPWSHSGSKVRLIRSCNGMCLEFICTLYLKYIFILEHDTIYLTSNYQNISLTE